MAKDKFKQMQKGGGARSSFQDMVQQAATVAAIEKQAAGNIATDSKNITPTPDNEVGKTTSEMTPSAGNNDSQQTELPRFMRLPNPQIPLNEYNLVSLYCASLPNMTRQDFVELAIVEKLHALGRLNDEDFNVRQKEIRNRPPRGQRKGTKIK